jgi:transcriptional regulator with XRE-family HTH domain
MARPIIHRTSRLGRVAQHFGLPMAEVAGLLGISPAQASQLAAGTRSLTREVSQRLAPFLDAVEAAPEAAEPLVPAGPSDPAPLLARRAACLHEAENLRWRCRPLAAQAQVAAHWAAARPALLAALPPPPAAADTPEAVRLRYAHARLALACDALPPAEVAQWHLLRLRADALEAEAAALAALLGGARQGQ